MRNQKQAVASSRRQSPAHEGGAPDRETSSPGARLVLVVDDDPELRGALEDVLTIEGFAVVTAANGAEALNYLERAQRRPDLILTDLLMPVMDGWQFLAARARRSHLRDIPVLVASATPSAEQTPPDIEILSKPVHLDQLLDALSRLLQ